MFTSPLRTNRWMAAAVGVAVVLASAVLPAAASASTPEPAASPSPTVTASPSPVSTEAASTPVPVSTAEADPAASPDPARSLNPDSAPSASPSPASSVVTEYRASGAGDAVPAGTVYAGPSQESLVPYDTAVPTASSAGVPYLGSLTISPEEISNYDLFAGGVTLTASGLQSSARAIITDTSPSGEVYTFDPVQTDWSGSVTTQVRRADRTDPEVGIHLFEIVTPDGRMAGARLNVVLSERLNAKATATPSVVSGDDFHDHPVVIEGSGFLPGEWLTVHITTPDGGIAAIAQDQVADASGKLRYLVQAGSAAVTPGPWQITILGMESTRNGVADFFVTPSPDNATVGTIKLSSDRITQDEFADPGLGYLATELPPFGLYDLSIVDANNREHAVGRFRADGDGVVNSTLFGFGAAPGRYGIRLINADNADEVDVQFEVTDADGNLPEPGTLTLSSASIDVRDLMDTGLQVAGTGYQPGETVSLVLRDQWRQLMRLSADSIAAKQADDTGAVSFTIRSFAAPEVGTWEVAVGNPLSNGLMQRADLEITDVAGTAPAPAPTPASPSDTAPGAAPGTGGLITSITGGQAARSWFVRTAGSGALAYDVAAQGSDALDEPVSESARQRKDDISRTLDAVTEAAQGADDDAAVLYKAVWTVPGVALYMDDAAAAAVAERSDVVSVTPIVTKQLVEPVSDETASQAPQNAASDLFTGALQAWTTGGKYTGEGVHIAVIDTGVDYTHTAFGGPGEGGRYWAMSGRMYSSAMPPMGLFYNPEKIELGWDFAGGPYSAGGGTGGYHPIPKPDTNPIDGPGGGHGTHVAATAAGWGVSADGTTFRGDPTTLTAADVNAMKVAPGSAPDASIIPLKVFGDFGGSTDLAGAALDWVGGQVAAGRAIDVVNMSLGSSFSAPDDPENDLVAALTAQGVVVAIAAGNAGDVTDVGGSPGNSEAALTVGAVSSGAALHDAVEVLDPSDVAGMYGAQFSIERDPYTTIDRAAPVVALTGPDLTGCTAFTDADRARIDGRIVWLEWDEKKLSSGEQCGSATRFQHALDAGASGVLLTSTVDQFEGGIGGIVELPGAQLTHTATEALRPALEAGRLAVRLADVNAQTIDAYDDSHRDTVASFTSRGVHGSVEDIIKPDVSGPGVNVISARMGSGDGSTQMSGTSMATPHLAGVAALVRQAHPDWSALRIKTVIMNSATHVVTDGAGTAVSPLRVGAGRVDAVQATAADVTVASEENGDLVTASFGVVEVGESGFTGTRTLTMTSTAPVDRTYTVGYDPRTLTPGAEFSLDATTIRVPAGGTATVTLTLSIPNADALRRTLDPGADQDADAHIADISGVVTFTPSDGTSPLWLTAFAAPKPVSTVAATDVAFAADATSATEAFAGDVRTQGDADAAYRTRVTPLIAGVTSPVNPATTVAPHTLAGADIVRVGAASTAPTTASPSQGRLAIGAQFAGPMVSLGATSHVLIAVDANRDGRDDFMLVPQLNAHTGLATVHTYDVGTGLQVDEHSLNGLSGPNAQWDNDTVVGAVDLAALGYTDTTTVTTIAYRVTTLSDYAPVSANGSREVDRTDWSTLDVYNPTVWFDTDAGSGDDAATAVTDVASVTVHQSAPSAGTLMLIGHDNGTGSRVSTASWSTAAAVTTTGIEVTTMPTKTHYVLGEALDPAGLIVSEVRSDGSRTALDEAAFTLAGFDSSRLGPEVITVTATIGGMPYQASFQVSVDDPTATTAPSPGVPGSGTSIGWDPVGAQVTTPGLDAGANASGGWSARGGSEDLATTGQDADGLVLWLLLAAVATGLGAALVIARRARRS